MCLHFYLYNIYIFFFIFFILPYIIFNKFNWIYICLVFLNMQIVNILILCVCLYLLKKNTVQYIYKVGVILLCMFSNLIWYNRENTFIFYLKHLPETLIIGFNNIHPILYYGGLILICFSIYNQKFYYYKMFKLNILLYILSYSLLLGMYWGVLSNSWGFFWVNDYIELLLLYICIISLLLLHCYSLRSNIYRFLLFIYLLVFVTFIIRFGLISTRHSFFLNVQISLYPVLIFIICFTIYLHIYCNIYIFIIGFCLGSMVACWLNFLNLNYTSCFFIYIGVYYILHYLLLNTTVLYIHMFFFSYIVMWLFSVNNNTVIFSYSTFIYNYNSWYIFSDTLYTYYKIILLTFLNSPLKSFTSSVNIVYTFVTNIYLKKFFLNMVTVLITYSYIFLLLIYLISIYKIYI